MTETEPGTNDPGLFDGYGDSQRELLAMELRKTRNKLLIVALIIFLSDLLGLLKLDALSTDMLLWILAIPAVITGLAFLSQKEPMAAIVIATLIILGLWIYVIVITDGRGAIMGILVKVIIITQLIAGFQSAREAQRIRKELVT